MFTAAAASVSHSHLHWMHVCCPWKSAAWILLISYSGCAPSLQMHVYCSLYPLPGFHSSLRYPCSFPIATGVSHTCTASSLLISHFHRFNTWSSHSHSILRAFPFNIYIFKFWGQQCAGTPALLLSHIRATLPTVQTKTLSRPDTAVQEKCSHLRRRDILAGLLTLTGLRRCSVSVSLLSPLSWNTKR